MRWCSWIFEIDLGVEFEFLVEKKMGTENKDNLLLWLMDLFPPESTDPSLQQIPEPQALPVQTYIPKIAPMQPVHQRWGCLRLRSRWHPAGAHTGNHRIKDLPSEATFRRAASPAALDVSSQSIPSMSVQLEPLSSEAFPSAMQVEEFEFDMDDKTEELRR